jgi:hypothetical protein
MPVCTAGGRVSVALGGAGVAVPGVTGGGDTTLVAELEGVLTSWTAVSEGTAGDLPAGALVPPQSTNRSVMMIEVPTAKRMPRLPAQYDALAAR